MKNKHQIDVSHDKWKAHNAWVYAVTNGKQALRGGHVGVLRLYKM